MAVVLVPRTRTEVACVRKVSNRTLGNFTEENLRCKSLGSEQILRAASNPS
jgi:hypothetical protein